MKTRFYSIPRSFLSRYIYLPRLSVSLTYNAPLSHISLLLLFIIVHTVGALLQRSARTRCVSEDLGEKCSGACKRAGAGAGTRKGTRARPNQRLIKYQ